MVRLESGLGHHLKNRRIIIVVRFFVLVLQVVLTNGAIMEYDKIANCNNVIVYDDFLFLLRRNKYNSSAISNSIIEEKQMIKRDLYK